MFTATEADGQIVLGNASNKVMLWPAHGAILNSWEITEKSRQFNLIDGYEGFEDCEKNGEAKGFRSMKLSPFVCRMKNGSYQFGGTPYTTNKFYLGQHAIHGLVYNKAYKTEKLWATEAIAGASFSAHYNQEDSGYPFDYTLLINYYLSGQHQVKIQTTVTNQSDTAIPIADGWHPYFSLGGVADDWLLQMNASQMLEFDDDLLPTGKMIDDKRFLRPNSLKNIGLDNCFVLDTPGEGIACRLVNPSEKITLEISAGTTYPYLQVYTPPHRKSIAIENLSAAPDSFNNGIGNRILYPGESTTFETTYTLHINSD